MKPPPPPPLLAPLLLSLFLLNPLSTSSATTVSSAASPATSPTSSPTSNSSSTLDPKQLRALQSLGIPTLKNPCSNPSLTDVVVCDKSSPFRHITSLKLKKCADDISVTTTALKSLSTLQDLQFINCPVAAPSRFPQELTSNLHSFTCIDSLGKLTGVMLGKMQNLTDLTVTGVPIIASGPVIILGNLKNLKSATISNTNLTGYLPKHWRTGITHLDLSNNNLKGKIPTTITTLEKLSALDLSSNNLSGEIPSSIGDLLELKNLSLSSNKLSGSIPDTLSAIPSLIYLNLSSNQLNGTIPSFIGKMKRLKYLNLESNNFAGVMPFTASFIEKLEVFKISENSNLCYNHSSISSKMKLGIAKCDKDGNPVSPPAEKADSPDSSDYDYNSEDASSEKSSGGEHHGPNKVVLGVAIGLSSIVFLIIFLILLSKWCA